ncbi:NAD(P)/FAD-dependent oxidoreductase [Paradesulfitobacterium ferrireducens]|uniref:NAD(P)/FAD-dependent oxidoreductase n=1 Tax=Paradesulfitobacterium ferrireducens TaxID=2816476 RepID=UPI001A8C89DA|nr:FAD-dependent oxidoreductase [Paradesulfitobacterium ferrireducens]
MKYIVVGNSAAGLFAAEAIREQDSGAEITVLTADSYPSYSRCLTTYYLAGDIPEEGLFLRSAETLEALHLNIRYGCTVTGLDPTERVILTAAGERVPYDKCLIATGASAVPLDVPGSTLPGVFTLRNLEDAQRIKARLAPGRRAVIIGGGLVSLKSAYALLKQGLKVSLIVSSGQILSQMLNEEAAKLIQEHLERHGLEIVLHQDVAEIQESGFRNESLRWRLSPFGQTQDKFFGRTEQESGEKIWENLIAENEIKGGSRIEAVRLRNGKLLPADLVIVGKGVRPNIQPFLDSGLATRQGILVNERLETNLPDVYAAGDVAEAWDRLHQTQRLNPIWPNATMQGRIAGANMAGLHLTYPGAMGMNSVDFFGLRTISAGIVRPPKSPVSENDLNPSSPASPILPTSPTSPAWRVEELRLRDAWGRPNYQRLVWQGELLKGFVLVGNTERAGILTAFIQYGRALSEPVRQTLGSGKRSRAISLKA